jgi:hypothetical protein
MVDPRTIKGQAWVSGNKLLQDQIIIYEGGKSSENTVILIPDIWTNLMEGDDTDYPVKEGNRKGYFYWEVEMNSIDDDSEVVKVFIECPKPRTEDFENLENCNTEWAKYWNERYNVAMENAEKKMTIQRKEIVFPGTNYIDPEGNLQEIEEKAVQVDHELGSIANLLMMF